MQITTVIIPIAQSHVEFTEPQLEKLNEILKDCPVAQDTCVDGRWGNYVVKDPAKRIQLKPRLTYAVTSNGKEE